MPGVYARVDETLQILTKLAYIAPAHSHQNLVCTLININYAQIEQVFLRSTATSGPQPT